MTRAVTANVRSALPRAAAARCLAGALDLGPDLVGLQEWRAPRLGLLAPTGEVRLAGMSFVLPGANHRGPMTWVAPLVGDCVVGLRHDRYVLRRHRCARLSRPRRADPGTRRSVLLPPRWATVVEADDRDGGDRIGVVVFHLVPGSQRQGDYRSDRERTARQHQAEVTRLGCLLAGLAATCSSVWALGDTNFHGLELPGVVSAWDGVPGSNGTLGSYRRIDDVFGPGAASQVETYVTESDHRMVLVDRVAAADAR